MNVAVFVVSVDCGRSFTGVLDIACVEIVAALLSTLGATVTTADGSFTGLALSVFFVDGFFASITFESVVITRFELSTISDEGSVKDVILNFSIRLFVSGCASDCFPSCTAISSPPVAGVESFPSGSGALLFTLHLDSDRLTILNNY